MKVDLITRLKHAYWDLTFLDINHNSLSTQAEGICQRLLELIYDLESLKTKGQLPGLFKEKKIQLSHDRSTSR